MAKADPVATAVATIMVLLPPPFARSAAANNLMYQRLPHALLRLPTR
jgi:hypothetical protein